MPPEPDPSDLSGAVFVLDTNILDATALLADPVSLALLFYLRRVDAQFGLPEIVRIEWHDHFIRKVASELSTFRRSAEWLGRATELSLDIGQRQDDTEVAEAAFRRRLDELEDILLPMPIADDHWRQAGEMVIQKRPPSTSTSQQYKDSLLWRAVLDLGKTTKVVLVSSDQGFSNEDGTGLEMKLLQEARDEDSDVALLTDILDVLETLRALSDTDISQVEEELPALESEFRDVVDSLLAPEGQVTRHDPREIVLEPFATPNPDEVVVVIRAEYELGVLDDPEFVFAEEAIVEAYGTGLIELLAGGAKSHVTLDYMETIVFTPHGNVVRDWDFGVPEFAVSRRISSLAPEDLSKRIARRRIRREEGKRRKS